MRTLSVAFLTALLLWLSACPASGELPPGSYVKLRKQAPLVLTVRVTKTAEDKDQAKDAALRKVICAAEIEGIEKAPQETSLKPGGTVEFDAYYLSKAAAKQGFAGPRWPLGPHKLGLKAGWRGRVYLQREEGQDMLQPAAYGESFQPLPAKVEQVAEPIIGNQPGARTASLDQRVGRNRRAVPEERNVVFGVTEPLDRLARALGDGHGRIVGRAGQFPDRNPPGFLVKQTDIGKCTAGIDADTQRNHDLVPDSRNYKNPHGAAITLYPNSIDASVIHSQNETA